MITAAARPGLGKGVRLVDDPVRDTRALLYPEGVLLLNETAAALVERCDGDRSVAEIIESLAGEYAGLRPDEVTAVLAELAERRLVVLDGGTTAGRADPAPGPSTPRPAGSQPRAPVPMGMLAEVTYRCPLQCSYCANPVALASYRDELGTADWLRVLDQARALGVLQVHLSGGEPMLRRDLAQLVAHARSLGMYTNLVTSGIPLPAARLTELVDAGLDHLQLSIQDSDPELADAIAGRQAHHRKLATAAMVAGLGIPLTINVVLHRANVDRLVEIAELAVGLGADRLELAHTQFYGWAWRNRSVLMPTAEQVAAAQRAAQLARERYSGRLEFVYVAADYHGDRPKPCMNGWGTRQFVVAPNGEALPCLAAAQFLGGAAPNVRTQDLATIWYASEPFNRFRGTRWMPEPCQSCAFKEVDFGGCRCQAFQLTGDPGVTDPACALSPDHHLVAESRAAVPLAFAAPRRLR